MLNVATKRYICLPYSGSWVIMKNWFKNTGFYERLDEINQYIASQLFETLLTDMKPFSTMEAMNAKQDMIMVALLSKIHTEKPQDNEDSGDQTGGAFITVLGRRRKVYMIGKTKMVNVCKVPIRLSKAYQMEKQQKTKQHQ